MASYNQERLGWIEAVVAGVEDIAEGILQVVTQTQLQRASDKATSGQASLTASEQSYLTDKTRAASDAMKTQFEIDKENAVHATTRVVGITAAVLVAVYLSSRKSKK